MNLTSHRENAPTITAVHVGAPPPDFNEWSLTKVYFHGFSDLSAMRNAHVDSPEFVAFGNPWCLQLFPGGLAINLRNPSRKGITLGLGYSVKETGRQIVNNQSSIGHSCSCVLW
jgi:hypothetical protein